MLPLSTYEFATPEVPDCRAIMGIRPEHIATGDHISNMPFNTEVEIELVEPMGSDTLVYAQRGRHATAHPHGWASESQAA